MDYNQEHFVKTGVLHEIGETRTFKNDFQVKEFVLKYADQKWGDQFYTFKLKGKHHDLNLLDGIQRGEALKVTGIVEGARKDYNGRYYNDIKAISIVREGQMFETTTQVEEDPKDDLPF